MVDFLHRHSDILAYASLPIISAFIGWFTNWLAIKMTFYPLRFWGIPPYLGWQGIIPRKSYKMAGKGADLIIGRLLKIEDLFEKPDPHIMSKQMTPPLSEAAQDAIENMAESVAPGTWERSPDFLKNALKDAVESGLPQVVTGSVDEMKKEIFFQMDLKAIMLKNLTGENVKSLVELFQRCGGPEFRFIEMTGLYLGFFLGIFQALVWHWYNAAWTLPVIGIIVGYFTNWLALQMIFRPLREKKYGFIRYQGLFLKRQDEVSREYAALIATKVLSAKIIMDELLEGSYASKVLEIARKNISLALESTETILRPLLTWVMGKEQYLQTRAYLVERLVGVVPEATRRTQHYLADAMQVEKTLYENLSQLDPETFEDVLRSAFREDEIILILVGAFLGFLIGFLQIFILT